MATMFAFIYKRPDYGAVIRVFDEAGNLKRTSTSAILGSGERSPLGFEPNKKPLRCRRR
jgi:hypothetical protein